MRVSEKVLMLVVLVGVIHSGFAIKCFICNNLNHGKECGHGEDVNQKFIKDCDTEADDTNHGIKYTMCRKITTWIEFDVNNNTATERVVRKCGYLQSKYDNNCYYRGGFGGRQKVCSCETDGCNSGFFTRANFYVIGLGASLLFLTSKI